MPEKIGVYFDKASVGPYLDLEALSEYVEEKFGDNVLSVKVHPLLASSAGTELIKAEVAEHELDGVLICGSSPRFDWEYYRVPGVQVERVNLREQCCMAYQEPDGSVPAYDPVEDGVPENLDMMSKEYVAMGVVRLLKSRPIEAQAIESTQVILVVGGGWTGMTAALNAAEMGKDVILLEKEASLGGKAKNLYKTVPLAYPHTTPHETGVEQKIAAVEASDKIKVLTGATLKKLSGAPGDYTATFSNGETAPVGSVVLATGWVPMDTAALAPMGYGSIANVVTAAEFEAMAKSGEIVTKDGKPAKRVAFLLNTDLCEPKEPVAGEACEEKVTAEDQPKAAEGDEDEETFVFTDMESPKHLTYSKQISSLAALKQAGYVREKYDDGLAFILYDHMIVQGIWERFYKAAQDDPGVMMSKAEIVSVEAAEDGSIVVVCKNTLLGESVEIVADMVVLPTGLVPTTAKSAVMNFDYRQGPAFPDLDLFDGFADSNYICFPYETRRTGVYSAGAVRQPMLMDACEDDAAGATLKAIQCIDSANRGVAVHPRSGDSTYPVFNFNRCTQCKRCTEECPFGALDDDEKGTPKPNPSRCRRCGTCMGACPERVISFDTYNIDMVGSMIREINVPDNMEKDGPRVLILACENDAYPAMDMAAMRGKHWSPFVRIIPVRCLGSVNAIWVADAMSKGVDGVMLLGCKYGADYQCHFIKGSEICNRRRDNIAESLNRLGVEAERVDQYEVAIDEYDKLPVMIGEFLDKIMALGPNPFKGY